MKKSLTILFFLSFSIISAQTGAINYEELLEQYPQLSAYASNRTDQLQNSLTQTTVFEFSDYTENELLMLDSLGVLGFLLDTTVVDEPTFFGYEFFNVPDKFAIFDNIPIPGDYRLGPGDQLIISIWGETQARSNHMINRDGDIFIDGLGQVNLTGLTITYAEKFLIDRFAEVYSTLAGKNPSTFLSLSLGQLKSINITFVGEVISPGIHAVHPFSDITTSLLQVGGIDTVGTLRNIQVIRDKKVISEFDFYEFLVDGKTPQNIRLINGDVVFVPVRQSTLEIEGEVNRPGIYESKLGDTVADIINHAGSFTPKAQKFIEIYRLLQKDDRNSEDYAYSSSIIDYRDTNNEPAHNLTKIRVLGVPDVLREVSILGQVKSPGTYVFEDSMKVMDLLTIAGGLNDATFLESIYTKEAEIIRQVSTDIYPKRIPINLEQLINGNGQNSQNVELKNLDIVIVRENRKFSNPKYVTLSGKINIPGKYTVQKKEESLEDIIKRAGGFAENAYVNGLQMYRDSIQIVLKGYDIFVADGDSVFVPESPGIVKIEGEVNREGLVQFVKGKSMGYYIESAGGFSYNANKKNITVHYANGNVRKKKSLIFPFLSISPPVSDGSTIIVYTKEPKPPFSATQFLTATASAATSIVTLYLLYQNSK